MEIQEMISKLDEVQKALAEMQKEKDATPKKSEWKQTWEHVLERLRNENPAIYSLLAERSVHYSPSDDYLTIWVEADSDFTFKTLREPANLNLIVEALNAEGMANVQAGVRKKKSELKPVPTLQKNDNKPITFLQEKRELAGWTRYQLAKFSHISDTALCNIEKQKIFPCRKYCESLKKTFGYHGDYSDFQKLTNGEFIHPSQTTTVLRQLREKAQLTSSEVSELTGINTGSLSSYERNLITHITPLVESRLEQLANLYGYVGDVKELLKSPEKVAEK